jgi:hypothetical protein
MSVVIIREQLEVALVAASAGLATAYENVPFTTVPGVPYQRCNILFGTPINPTTDWFYRQPGFLQATLYYPLDNGAGPAQAQAMLLRVAFQRTYTYQLGKVTTIIDGTADIMPSSIDEDRFVIPVRIPFYANVLP